MAYFIYIIKSESTDRYYCGSTDDVARRVREHNDQGSKGGKKFEGPWELIWSQAAETRGEAMALERKIEKRGISRFLRDQTNDADSLD
jgi:putative endonuclease